MFKLFAYDFPPTLYHFTNFATFVWNVFDLLSPEFQYRPGLGALSEDSTAATAATHVGSSGPPNRPLPPTPDDDGDPQGDRTLIMKRVCFLSLLLNMLSRN